MGDEQVAAQRGPALGLVELAAYSPPEFLAGDLAADADGAHEPTVLVQRLGRVLCRLLACSLAMSRLAVVCRVFVPDGEDRTLAGHRRGQMTPGSRRGW